MAYTTHRYSWNPRGCDMVCVRLQKYQKRRKERERKGRKTKRNTKTDATLLEFNTMEIVLVLYLSRAVY